MHYTLIKHAIINQSESLLEWYKKSDWVCKSKAVKNVKPSKFKTHQSSYSAIVYKLSSSADRIEFVPLKPFGLSNTESEAKCSEKSG